MAVCTKHGEFITHPMGCTRCQWAESVKNKKEKQISKYNKPKVQSELEKLKAKGQRLISKWMKDKYCPNTFTNCVTCGKPKLTKGTNVINTIHCGHYFPKSKFWLFALDKRNVAPQCYDCNVNNPECVPAMRSWLVRQHGEEAIKKLEKEAERFIFNRNIGIIKSRPDELWLNQLIGEFKM